MIVESNLKEETTNLMKRWEEERIAKLEAEENYKSTQITSNMEIQKLKRDVEAANRRPDRPRPKPICSIL
ncbi:hypothetical protein CR513_32947, partial [Mucuna pruriens]